MVNIDALLAGANIFLCMRCGIQDGRHIKMDELVMYIYSAALVW